MFCYYNHVATKAWLLSGPKAENPISHVHLPFLYTNHALQKYTGKYRDKGASSLQETVINRTARKKHEILRRDI